MIRRSYREVAQPPTPESVKGRDKRSADLFAEVQRWISTNPAFAHLPEGDPWLIQAVLYCRSRKLPASRILGVRDQLMQRWGQDA
jgi:hypothetical protein